MASRPPDFGRLLARLTTVLDRRGVPFMLIGGQAEDLIVHKLFAGRPRDLDDAASVVRRKGPELDWDYLREWAGVVAQVEGREGMPAQLEALREE